MDNPILQFESERIRSTAPKRIHNRIWTWGYVLLIILTLLAIGALLLFPNVPLVAPHQVSFFAVPILILQAVLNLILLVRTLVRATIIMGRERTSTPNWEAFILTGTDARTVVMGKWRVVVRSLWREFLLMGIIRAVIFPAAVILHRIHSEYPYLAPHPYSLSDFIPTLPTVLFGMFAIMLMTAAQLPLMAAIGVFAASRRSTHAAGFGRGLSTWMLIMLGTALLIALAFFAYNQSVFHQLNMASRSYYSWLAVDSRLLEMTILGTTAIADTGIISPAILTTAAFYAEPPHWSRGIIFGLVLAVYGFWTWAALRLSILLCGWQGMTKANSR